MYVSSTTTTLPLVSSSERIVDGHGGRVIREADAEALRVDIYRGARDAAILAKQRYPVRTRWIETRNGGARVRPHLNALPLVDLNSV
jgi:hypothetical protein